MPKYNDEEIRNMPKITIKIAAEYLGVSMNAITLGLRNNLLPIGYAVKNEDTFSESWTYTIFAERMIAYKYGKITNIQIENIEKSLNNIIEEFKEMKKDLLFILSENEE